MATLLVSPNGVSHDLRDDDQQPSDEGPNHIDDSVSDLTLEQAFREQSSRHVLKNTKLVKLFFDNKLKTGSWNELTCRRLPNDNAQRIVNSYAFTAFNINFKLNYDGNGSRKFTRKYHCPICKKFSVTLKVANSDQPKEDWEYQVDESTSTVGTNICSCKHIAVDGNKKLPVCAVSLVNHPGVRSIVRKYATLRAHFVKHKVKEYLSTILDEVDMGKLNSTALSNVVQQLQVIYIHQSRRLYNDLPAFLEQLCRQNEEVGAALQSHLSDGCPEIGPFDEFGRLFVGFPIAKHHGRLTLPVLVVDCFHYQCHQYDGVAITICAKTGFGRIVMLAFGIIPVEDLNNTSWFLQLCVRHGIDFSQNALFTDQGPLISAVRKIKLQLRLQINLFVCLQHFHRNIRAKFSLFFEGPVNIVLRCLHRANEAITMNSFFEIMDELFMTLAMMHSSKQGFEQLYLMATYIFSIHPKHWTVFANCPCYHDETYETRLRYLISHLHSLTYIASFNLKSLEHRKLRPIKMYKIILFDANRTSDDEASELFHTRGSFFKKALPENSRSCPLFFHSKTNMAESMASRMGRCGGRYHIPPLSILYFFEEYNKQIYNLVRDLKISQTEPMNPLLLTTIGIHIKFRIGSQGGAQKPTLLNVSSQTLHDGESRDEFAQTFGPETTDPVGVNLSASIVTTKLTGLFTHHGRETSHGQETFEATLLWHHDETNPFSFKHTCERHVENSAMLQSPCACVGLLVEHARENKLCGWPADADNDCLQFLYPTCLQAKATYEYLHATSGDGRPVGDGLFLSIPTYERARNNWNEMSIPAQPLVSFNALPGATALDAAPKYKHSFSQRRFRSIGEGSNSSAIRFGSTRKSRQEGLGRYASEGTRVVGYQPPTHRKGLLDAISQDQDELTFSTDNQRLLSEKLGPAKRKKCRICRKVDCRQGKCLTLFTWGKPVKDLKRIKIGRYYVYKLASSGSASGVTLGEPQELFAGPDVGCGLDFHIQDETDGMPFDHESYAAEVEGVSGESYNARAKELNGKFSRLSTSRSAKSKQKKRGSAKKNQSNKRRNHDERLESGREGADEELYGEASAEYLQQVVRWSKQKTIEDESFADPSRSDIVRNPYDMAVTDLQAVAFGTIAKEFSEFVDTLNKPNGNQKYKIGEFLPTSASSLPSGCRVVEYDKRTGLYKVEQPSSGDIFPNWEETKEGGQFYSATSSSSCATDDDKEESYEEEEEVESDNEEEDVESDNEEEEYKNWEEVDEYEEPVTEASVYETPILRPRRPSQTSKHDTESQIETKNSVEKEDVLDSAATLSEIESEHDTESQIEEKNDVEKNDVEKEDVLDSDATLSESDSVFYGRASTEGNATANRSVEKRVQFDDSEAVDVEKVRAATTLANLSQTQSFLDDDVWDISLSQGSLNAVVTGVLSEGTGGSQSHVTPMSRTVNDGPSDLDESPPTKRRKPHKTRSPIDTSSSDSETDLLLQVPVFPLGRKRPRKKESGSRYHSTPPPKRQNVSRVTTPRQWGTEKKSEEATKSRTTPEDSDDSEDSDDVPSSPDCEEKLKYTQSNEITDTLRVGDVVYVPTEYNIIGRPHTGHGVGLKAKIIGWNQTDISLPILEPLRAMSGNPRVGFEQPTAETIMTKDKSSSLFFQYGKPCRHYLITRGPKDKLYDPETLSRARSDLWSESNQNEKVAILNGDIYRCLFVTKNFGQDYVPADVPDLSRHFFVGDPRKIRHQQKIGDDPLCYQGDNHGRVPITRCSAPGCVNRGAKNPGENDEYFKNVFYVCECVDKYRGGMNSRVPTYCSDCYSKKIVPTVCALGDECHQSEKRLSEWVRCSDCKVCVHKNGKCSLKDRREGKLICALCHDRKEEDARRRKLDRRLALGSDSETSFELADSRSEHKISKKLFTSQKGCGVFPNTDAMFTEMDKKEEQAKAKRLLARKENQASNKRQLAKKEIVIGGRGAETQRALREINKARANNRRGKTTLGTPLQENRKVYSATAKTINRTAALERQQIAREALVRKQKNAREVLLRHKHRSGELKKKIRMQKATDIRQTTTQKIKGRVDDVKQMRRNRTNERSDSNDRNNGRRGNKNEGLPSYALEIDPVDSDVEIVSVYDPDTEFLSGRKEEDVLFRFPFRCNTELISACANGLPVIQDGIDVSVRKWALDLPGRSTVTVYQYKRLKRTIEYGWLDDQIFLFCSRWVSKFFNQESRSDIIIFNSHFWQSLRINEGGDYETPISLSKHLIELEGKIFEKKLILLPVCHSDHWTLCVLVHPGLAGNKAKDVDDGFPCILYFDSLLSSRKGDRSIEDSKLIRKFLNFFWRKCNDDAGTEKFSPESYPVYNLDLPSQRNGYDCGLFVCRYIYALYNLSDQPYTYRSAGVSNPTGIGDQNVWSTIERNELFRFSQDDVARLRDDFKLLIRNLSKLFVESKQG